MIRRFRFRATAIGLEICLVAWVLVGCRDGVIAPCSRGCIGPPYEIISAETLVKNLEIAYRKRDYEKFRTLLSNPETPGSGQPEFTFWLSAADPGGERSWSFEIEDGIARRMFCPQDTRPGEPAVRPDLWLQSVDIKLTQASEFIERPELYSSSSNPRGLDPARWRATSAIYRTRVFFQLVGSTDYLVDAGARFVVIEDKTKTNSDPGKWLIYRWEDLPQVILVSEDPQAGVSVENTMWGRVKQLYK